MRSVSPYKISMRRAKALFLDGAERIVGVNQNPTDVAGRTVIVLIVANLFAAALLYLVYLVF
ncbi:hypothetical protein D0C36_04720 [Mucilaginibacter conchicola]|uniref:Uncharacterized protein n=2 Tax=Mucilaginibacter conchicola TaxID=2303333 RepID=A0A372NY85_9SPHI|nr:hypothetical protein D0C36_04720 [Mucilaginibacter conchicola]